MLLCVFGIASAARPPIECSIKNDTIFGPNDRKITQCEFKEVTYIGDKKLEFSHNDSTAYGFLDLRVKFVESHIQSIPSNLFDQFSRLEILEVNHVGLRNIFQNSFKSARFLKTLQAFGNRISIVHAYSFVGAETLENLDLSNNIITNIHHESFSGLENLKELSLSSNWLTIIDEHTFQPLKNLSWIWLDRNQIKIISVNLLVSSQKLRGIYLNNNRVSALSTVLFDNLPELEFLFLEGNNCTNKNFVNTRISTNSNVKKELSKCFDEFRNVVPDEEEKFRLKHVLKGAEKANAKCEEDKAALLKRLEETSQKLTNLQQKNGK